MSLNIAVLAVQGAFREHESMLRRLGCIPHEIRCHDDWFLRERWDGLILPGGESTVQGKLLRVYDLLGPIHDAINDGLPVLATCAGLILLAHHISNEDTTHIGTMPLTVRRNAYGRQVSSFQCISDLGTISDFPMVFIRAPYIEKVENDITSIARIDGHIVAARYHNQIGLAFHPELTDDTRIHESFLEIVRNHTKKSTHDGCSTIS
ncbi:MAG: pyridoxal 5'-phosphate synthase glutaminase subunit PdxT [Veillonellaceae bacterium]|nr:pyridoxal 5'-phosphate synthase glutaminase subunit PdxT [Veillonellaceae bacterium]MDD6923786.1 pyridoxal 5'-phosphate synthase glutaminase subunit PdxT [Veillonellaceae bacterium]